MEGMGRGAFNAGDEAERIDPTEPSELHKVGGAEDLPPELADGDEKPGIGEPDEEAL